jgi:hypothetical protein
MDECHQLTFADPTLELHPDMVAGWYLGGEGMYLQSEFPRLIKCLSEHLGVQRRIYTGGSAGGFASLYYSLRDPGCACVVVNPLTNLFSYKNSERQLRLIWPAIGTINEIGKRVTIDLPAAYDLGFENLIIYLQSNGDLLHYGKQMRQFCEIGLKSPEKFILHIGYWGVPSHSDSVPINEYRLWVKAVSKSSWLNRQSILDVYHSLSTHFAQNYGLGNDLRNTFSEEKADAASVLHNLRLANKLRDHHLS